MSVFLLYRFSVCVRVLCRKMCFFYECVYRVAMCVRAERRRRQDPTAGQLDDVRQSEAQLFIAGTVSILLQRVAEHVSAPQATPHLCRLYYVFVSYPPLNLVAYFPLESLCGLSYTFFKYLIY